MRRTLSIAVAGLLAITGTLAATGVARADINNSTATNVQQGGNTATTNQAGKGKSGSAVGGQVSGVVSSGRASVDAKNTSTNSDVTSGDARGSNTASSFTGLNVSDEGPDIGAGSADINNSGCSRNQGCNLQDGTNRLTQSQTANATTGDGVAGEVIGLVASGGSSSIVAANTTTDSSAATGDATSNNTSSSFVGEVLTEDGPSIGGADINNSGCSRDQGCNLLNGSNRATLSQTSTSVSGDGVAGQVIGGVSGGNLSIDANNTTSTTDVTSGDATSTNDIGAFVGLTVTRDGPDVADISNNICNRNQGCNIQDGNNRLSANQTATSHTGDGVGGEVIGAVTSAGGSASIVAANSTKDSSVQTGDGHATNDLGAFVGLSLSSDEEVGGLSISDLNNDGCNRDQGCNMQNGDNRLTGSQSATSTTGDGVAGQVLGVVSAGAASVDARNTTDSSDVTTGDSHANNDAAIFVGLNISDSGPVIGADITNSGCDSRQGCNIQDGNNTKTLGQSASATTGDGIAGQVSGVVTSAGGSASVVLANTSTNISSDSGNSDFSNTENSFVGQNLSDGALTVL